MKIPRRHWIQGARAYVVAVAVAMLGLIAAQQIAGFESYWVELSRYLPFFWLLPPCVLAVAVSVVLGWRWIAGSLAVLALAATVPTGLVLNWSGDPNPEGSASLRVMSYNVKALVATELSGGMAALDFEVRKHEPDVVLMQDANGLFAPRGVGVVSSETDGLKIFGLPHAYVHGQYAIASRHPLRDCALLKLDADAPGFTPLKCTVTVAGRDISLVNAHLTSPRMGLVAARREGLDGGDDWERNYAQRLTEARGLLRALADLPRPLIVGGDLNAPQSSPVVQTLMAAGLRNAYGVAGRGWGYSYGQAVRHRLGTGMAFLRIDHVLASPDIAITRAWVGGGGASEHQPVVADLALKAAR
jgi:endonuclease/exonuclease/phosphatase (EEP) superfamily protein YafD